MSFCEILSRLMKDTDISAKKLGENIGVSDVIIGKWQKGESSPNLNNAIALANYFDISLDELADIKKDLGSNVYSKLPIFGTIYSHSGMIHIVGLPDGEYVYTNNKELDYYNPSECYCLKLIDGFTNLNTPVVKYIFIHQQNQCDNGDYVVYQQMDSITESGMEVNLFSLRKFVRSGDNIELKSLNQHDKNYVFRKQNINQIRIQGIVINPVVLS